MPILKSLLLPLLALAACQPTVETVEPDTNTVTLLFTNDVESAYDPIPAFWLEDQEMIGGIAEMTTLIKDSGRPGPMSFCSIPGTSSRGLWPNSPRDGWPLSS